MYVDVKHMYKTPQFKREMQFTYNYLDPKIRTCNTTDT